jgi:hypothetical protein
LSPTNITKVKEGNTTVGRKRGTWRKKENEKKEENENPYLLF